MSTFTFPPLRLAVLQGLLSLKEQYLADDKFLRGSDVPYDIETVEALEKIFEKTEVVRTVEKIVQPMASAGGSGQRGRPRKVGLTGDDNVELENTVKDLLENLKNMDETKEHLEVSERVAITKTKAALIEQLIKARERIFNIKRVSDFQTTVVGILDDLIDEQGRDAFLDRIQEYI